MSKDVLLASTLHDPRGVFRNSINGVARTVTDNYAGWVVNVTHGTDEHVKQALVSLGAIGVYKTETTDDLVPDAIENDHLTVLARAYEFSQHLKIPKIQYTDGDRIIMAGKYYPNDLHEMAKTASNLTPHSFGYLNLRRSPADFLSHHPPLVETEWIINGLYSEAFGLQLDVVSTAHVMSDDIVEHIVRLSPHLEPVSFPHPKWLFIASNTGAKIQSQETQNVLMFETPEQFIKEVGDRLQKPTEGSYSNLQQAYMATLGRDSTVSEREWTLRFGTLFQYLRFLNSHLEELGMPAKQEHLFSNLIDQTIKSEEARKKAILEAIARTDEEIKAMINMRAERAMSGVPYPRKEKK